MRPKTELVIQTAIARPDWTQAKIADYCHSTLASVKVLLWRARKEGKIGSRKIDRERSRKCAERLAWLPDARRPEYFKLRGVFKAEEAKRIILEDLSKVESGHVNHSR